MTIPKKKMIIDINKETFITQQQLTNNTGRQLDSGTEKTDSDSEQEDKESDNDYEEDYLDSINENMDERLMKHVLNKLGKGQTFD